MRAVAPKTPTPKTHRADALRQGDALEVSEHRVAALPAAILGPHRQARDFGVGRAVALQDAARHLPVNRQRQLTQL